MLRNELSYDQDARLNSAIIAPSYTSICKIQKWHVILKVLRKAAGKEKMKEGNGLKDS